MSEPTTVQRSQARRARTLLSGGVHAFRWTALVWMAALAATSADGFVQPQVAWMGIGAAVGWTIWMSVPRPERSRDSLWFELGLATSLNVIAGWVVPVGTVVGDRPFYATAWPVTAAIAWGVASGPLAGGLAGMVLGAGILAGRAVNDIPPQIWTTPQWQSFASAAITAILAGAFVGLVTRLFDRAAEEYEGAVDEIVRAREQAARAAERESMAREIHDSILQSLSLIHKRGKELGTQDAVPRAEVLALADAAAEQEAELRAMILREPEEPTGGARSLRAALEQLGRGYRAVRVSVASVGPVWVPAHIATEVVAAVRQALDNVVEHAEAGRATVFAERDGDWTVVTVVDDGRGFVYDEDALRRDGKAGLLMSIKGRVEAVGGRMGLRSTPFKGTEIELTVPTPDGETP